jgi:hypothetical protein
MVHGEYSVHLLSSPLMHRYVRQCRWSGAYDGHIDGGGGAALSQLRDHEHGMVERVDRVQ